MVTDRQVENGDLNWCIEGSMAAFAGERSLLLELSQGLGPQSPRYGGTARSRGLPPAFFVPYFKARNVTLVIRQRPLLIE